MHPYRDPLSPAPAQELRPPPSRRALRLAYAFVLAWTLVGGAQAAWDGRASRDLWLAVAVAIAVVPALYRAYEPRR